MAKYTILLIAGILSTRLNYPFILISSLLIVTIFILKKGIKKSILLFIVFLSGYVISWITDHPYGVNIPRGEASITGKIKDIRKTENGSIVLHIKESNINGVDINKNILLYVPESLSRGLNINRISPGDRVMAIARFSIIQGHCNQGVYDFTGKIRIRGRVKALKIIETSGNFIDLINRSRYEISKIIERSLSKENSAFIKAITIGYRSEISNDLRNAFNRTGLSHLLSISGTHLGLFSFMTFFIVKWLVYIVPHYLMRRLSLYFSPQQVAAILVIPCVIVYAVISGLRIPTIRALIMIIIYMSAIILGRRGQILNSLYLAAIIILIFNPSSISDLSFMLSFSAVFFIGCFLERERSSSNTEQRHLLQRVMDKLKQGLVISMAATLGTAPLIIYVFNGISLLTPFTNLFMTPLVCFLILPPALIFSFMAYMRGYELMPFHDLIDQIVSWVISFVKYLSSIPHIYIYLPDPRIPLIASYYFSLYIFSRSRSWFGYTPLIVMFMIYIIGNIYSPDSERLRITFLDVGQGDASFIELPDGRKMLIDSGSEIIHSGRNIIAPYLLSKGIRKIDFLVLTHPHPDHYGGMLYIIDNFDIKEVWLNGQGNTLIKELLRRDIKIRYPKRGDVLNGRGYRIYILHPYDGFMPLTERGEYSDINNESLVLKIETKGHSVLLTGDIEQEAEEDLIHLGHWLRSEVLKVPHHGGRTSSSNKFLEMVNPVIGVISAGENNPFNHPHDETLRRLKLHHIQPFRTDIDGSVTITFNKDKIFIQTCR